MVNSSDPEDADSGAGGAQRTKGKRVVLSKYTRHACNQCKKAKTKCEGKPICERCMKTGHDCIWVEDNRKALTRHHEQALRHRNELLQSEVNQLKDELDALRAKFSEMDVQKATSSPSSSLGGPALPSQAISLDSGRSSNISDGLGGQEVRNRSKTEIKTLADAEAYYSDISSDRDGASGSSGSRLDADGDLNIADAEDANNDSRVHRVTWGDLGGDHEGDDDVFGSDESDDESDDTSDESGDSYSGSDEEEEGEDEGWDLESGVNRLVAPNKTLFVEYDDLHLYGLTSVFRLRQSENHSTGRRPHGTRSSSDKHQARLKRSASTRTVRPTRSSIRLRPSTPKTPRSRSRARAPEYVEHSSSASSSTSDLLGRQDLVLPPTSRSKSRTRFDDKGSGRKKSVEFLQDSAKTRSDGRKAKRKKRRRAPSGASTLRAASCGPSEVDEEHCTRRFVLMLQDSTIGTDAEVEFKEGMKHLRLGEDAASNNDFGADEGRCLCEKSCSCWSQCIPEEVRIVMSRAEHDLLLDRSFLFFTSWCMRVIPDYFLRDMHRYWHHHMLQPNPSLSASSGSVPTISENTLSSLQRQSKSKPAHYTPFLHLSLLSVASAFSDLPIIRSSVNRHLLVESAKSYIESECARPSVSAVQALSLLASFYSGLGEQTLGWMYFGMSARIGMALGLNADPIPIVPLTSSARSRAIFDRLWCFHMSAAQDACWSLYVGRAFAVPISLDEERDDARALEGLTQEGLDNMAWRMPHVTISNNGESAEGVKEGELGGVQNVQKCGTFTIFLWSCRLMKVARRIMDLMNRLGKNDNGTEIKLLVADIDIQLIAWREDLPVDLKLSPSNEATALPHKLMMHLAYWWLLILLHRPFYRRKGIAALDLTFSVNRCNLAAREILSLLRSWRRIYGSIRFTPITLIQIAFASGTIYIMSALQAGMPRRRRPAIVAQEAALENVLEIVGMLREMGESWRCAERIAEIFDKLVKEQRRVLEKAQQKATGNDDEGSELDKEARKEGKKRKRTKTVTPTGAATPKLTAAKKELSLEDIVSTSTIGQGTTNVAAGIGIPQATATSSDFSFFLPQNELGPHNISFGQAETQYNFSPAGEFNVPSMQENLFHTANPNANTIGSGGEQSYTSDSESVASGFMDYHASGSDGEINFMQLYNNFNAAAMEVETSAQYNDGGHMFGNSMPNVLMPGMGMADLGLSMIDGSAFAMQPFMAFGSSQAPGVLGGVGFSGGFSELSGLEGFSGPSGNNGHFGYSGTNGQSGSEGVYAALNALHGNSSNPEHDFDLTSDGEDRALLDVISSLGSATSQFQQK